MSRRAFREWIDIEPGAEQIRFPLLVSIMWHSILITAHPAAGGIALLAGCVALRGGALLRTHLGFLIGMELSLALAIAVEWPGIGPGARTRLTGTERDRANAGVNGREPHRG